MAFMDATTLAAGLVVAGKYALTRPLARGAMGEVWIAKHTSLGGEVAIKFLSREPAHDGEDPATAMARFRFEAQVAAKLSRKTRHIVTVTDHGEELGWAYLVMELVDGVSLENRLKQIEMRIEELVPIVWQVARGLAHAHGEGVFHRDLKPANLLLTKDEDGELLVKILDFGIAKTVRQRKITHSGASQSHATEVGIVLGTPNYMSPEQARGLSTLDHRCDLWALSVVAYEALTSRLPYDGETTADLLVNICSDDPTPVRKYRPELPPDIEGFFKKAFAASIRDRYPDAAALAQAFAEAAKSAIPAEDQLPTVSLPAVSEPVQIHDAPFQVAPSARAAAVSPEVSGTLKGMPNAIATLPNKPSSMSLEAYEPPRRNTGVFVVLGLIAIAAIALLAIRFTGSSAPKVEPPPPPVAGPPKEDFPAPTVPPPATTNAAANPQPTTSSAPPPPPVMTTTKPTPGTKPTAKTPPPTATTAAPTTTAPPQPTAQPPKPLDKGEIL